MCWWKWLNNRISAAKKQIRTLPLHVQQRLPLICPNRGFRFTVQQLLSRLRQHCNNAKSRVMIVTALVASLCACTVSTGPRGVDETQKLSPRVIRVGDPVPKGGGVYKLGDPYLANGKWYVPVNDRAYDKVGEASWYGDFFHGRRTANGEVYDMNGLTAAHPTLPMPTYAAVTNLANNRTVVVRINDRGPYHEGRIIDLSRRAAELLGLHGHGTGTVRVRYFGEAPLNGDDSFERRMLGKQPWATSVVATSGQTAKPNHLFAAAAMAAQASPTPKLVVQKGPFERRRSDWTATAQPLTADVKMVAGMR
jgi:rare lipoprotein A